MLTPTKKAGVRASISEYCLKAEKYRLKWHYTKQRPFHGYMVDPSLTHNNDCSGYVSLAFNWAMHKNGIYLHDPLDEHYTGQGYTGTEYAYLKQHSAPVDKYLIGDMAIFGTPSRTVHTSICRKAGTRSTAIFSSNGHESWDPAHDAPNPTTLAGDSRLLGVYRHPGLL